MEAKDFVMGLKGLGFTQVEIADATGVAQSTISKIERGHVEDVMSRSYRALQAFYEQNKTDSKTPTAIAGAGEIVAAAEAH